MANPISNMTIAPVYPPRSQSRTEGTYPSSRADTLGGSTAVGGLSGISSPSIQIPSGQGSHIRPSPQKSVRTYDSKLISKEMDRLAGMPNTSLNHSHSHPHPGIAHHSHSLPHAIAQPGVSASTLSLVPTLSTHAHTVSSTIGLIPTSMSGSSSASGGAISDSPWSSLHVHVLPLFNGEPLRMAIEDLNSLVKRHLHGVVARAPARAISTLESDVKELLATGMITLNSKLNGVEDEKLLTRVVDIWVFFWDQILPYIEGVLLPLQSDQLLLSLMRTSKPVRPSSPTHAHHTEPTKTQTLTSAPIEVRKLTLRSFRDAIILPVFERMHSLVTAKVKDGIAEYSHPRLQQMLLVLSSTKSQSISLTASAPPSPGEHAISHLLAAIRDPSSPLSPLHPYESSRLRPRSMGPSSFSGGAPRDRRGRIVRKDALEESVLGFIPTSPSPTGEGGEGVEGFAIEAASIASGHRPGVMMNEKEFLDSLKSPDLYQGEDEGRMQNPVDAVHYNVEYDYDSDEHSEDEEDQTTRTGLSMNDWDHRLSTEGTERESSLEVRREATR